MHKNKLRNIILCILVVMIVSVISINTIVKKDNYIMYDGIMLAMTLTDSDGTKDITEFPSGSNYHVEIDCDNAKGFYKPVKVLDANGAETSEYEMKFTIEEITGAVRCKLSFIEIIDSNKNNYYLKNMIENTNNHVTQGNEGIVYESATFANSNGDNVVAGYRYEGTNPDNYVLFNNELWRIIGSIPTCTASGCTSKENLVKIIKNDDIGAFAYDALSSGYTGAWGSNTLKELLNTYYYGKGNGTDSDYCYRYRLTAKGYCNYTYTGISNSSSDYYGKMVKEVYWNTGSSTDAALAGTIYTNEMANQTINGHVGLMNASDFAYATSASHDINASTYNTVEHTLKNWLFILDYEWTINQSSTASDALRTYLTGRLYSDDAYNGYRVRPVVYLNSNVYIINGSGTMADPYIIGLYQRPEPDPYT